MNSPSIRIGVVGAGANTRKMHIPNLQAISGVEIASVCNRSVESGQRAADEFGIHKVCSSWSELVEDPDIDAVVIGTWPNMHQPVTCAALGAGKHVLCEARMAMNAAEARAMWEADRAHPHLIAQLVPSPFTLAFDATLQELVRDRFLGDVTAIDLRHVSGGFPDRDAAMTWRQDVSLSGLNILTMGIWYEALSRWVGHARTVFAGTRQIVKMRPRADGRGAAAVRVPDHVDVIADMDCGAQARMQFSAVLGLANPACEVWLFGTEGTLRLDGTGNKLYGGRRNDKALTEILVPPENRGHWRVEEEFINAIRGIEPVSLTTFAEGLRYMTFTEAVAASAATGKLVTL